MKKICIGIAIIVIGISIILYPIISNIIASYTQTVVIENYRDTVEQMAEEEVEEEKEKAREYNDSLSDSSSVSIKLDNDENTENSGTNYYNALNVGEVIGYISIPKISVYLPIYHGTSEAVLQSGVGHVENTSLPIGEKNTHVVLAGHTGLVKTKIFDDIDQLEIGDKFYLYVLNEEYAYQVDQIKVVLPDNNEDVAIVEGEEYVTLLTCTPYGINSHRLLVRGTRIELNSEAIDDINVIDDSETEIVTESKDILYKAVLIIGIMLLGLIVLVIILITATRVYKAKRRK